jgi:ribosomal protein L29
MEVNRLRKRVSELEAELAELRTGTAEIDLELHRMTGEVTLHSA